MPSRQLSSFLVPRQLLKWLGRKGLFVIIFLVLLSQRKYRRMFIRRLAKLQRRFLSEDTRDLMKIVFPTVWCPQSGLLILHSLFLVSRTVASLLIAQLDGILVRHIIDKDLTGFSKYIIMWILMAIPTSFINSMLQFLERKLAYALQSCLVRKAYEQYMANDTYYKVGNLDCRLPNPDQCLTEDIEKFCQSFCQIYSSVSKPVLDCVIMTTRLIQMGRGVTDADLTPVIALTAAVVGGTGTILKVLAPPFGRLVASREELHGDLRNLHARVMTHSEEIAFFNGDRLELKSLLGSYGKWLSSANKLLSARLWYIVMEQFFMKYCWSATGLILMAYPAMVGEKEERSASERTEAFVIARKLMVDGADAAERIISANKDVAELGGYASRVNHLFKVLDAVSKGEFVCRSVEDSLVATPKAGGKVSLSDTISCSNVTIMTPTGDALARELTFDISPGMHLLICGPNGCGKTSLFRMLGDLWPVAVGEVTHPKREEIVCVPQRPYLTTGTLREQFIYPHTLTQMRAKGWTDEKLQEVMRQVRLDHVEKREGGLDASKDWRDVLSGGEKQRVGFGRVLYHKPKYAILDECTSQVSIDVEGEMYTVCKSLGITMLTVSHRPSLWQYHTHILQFDGHGGWKFSELDASKRLELREEKSLIESQLRTVPEQRKRLKELCEILGEESTLLAKVKTLDSAPSSPTRSGQGDEDANDYQF